MRRSVCFTAMLLTCLAAVPAARTQTTSGWTGAVSTDWNTVGNWTPSGVPNAANANVDFGSTGIGTVNISSTVSIASLLFNNPTGNYTLTSGAGQVLNAPNGLFLTVDNAVTGTITLNLANVSTGSLALGGALVVNNSTASGTTLVIGPSTVIGGAGGPIFYRGVGKTVISGSFAGGANQEVNGLSADGPGTLILSGNGGNLAGGLSLGGGTYGFDYSSNPASKLGGGQLGLFGGTLTLTANANTPVTQTIPGGTGISDGHVDVLAAGSGTVTLAAGAIGRGPAGTANFAFGGSPIFSVTTTTGTTNGLLGSGPAFATSGGLDWATVSNGAIVPFSNYATNTFTPNGNVSVTASSSQSDVTVNSLKFSNALGSPLTLTLSGSNTLQSGGILFTGAGGNVVTGGTITAPPGTDLIVHANDSLLASTINSDLVSTVGLTKTGSRALSLGGNNTGLSGRINVNRGGLTLTKVAAVNSASGIFFNDQRLGVGQTFTVDLGNNVSGTITPPVGVSPTPVTTAASVFSTGSSLNSRVTLSGNLTDYSEPLTGLVTSVQFTGDASNTSGFNLTGANSFNNSVLLSHGFLGVTGDASLGAGPSGAAPRVFLGVGSATAGGLEFLGSFTFNRAITINSTSRVIVDAGDVVTDPALLGSAGSGTGFEFVKAGPGTLILADKSGGLGGGLALNGGTLVFDYSANANSKLGGGALTLDGGVLSITPNPSTAITQTIPGGTVVAAGHTDLTAFGSGSVTLALGAIPRSAGATLDVASPPAGTTFSVATSGNTLVANGLLGPGPGFATFGGGVTWATEAVAGGPIVGFPTPSYAVNTFTSAAANVDVTASSSQSGFTVNSLRFNTTGVTLTLSGTSTLLSGGVLVTPTGAGTIIGGTLTGANGGELIFHTYAPLIVNSVLSSSTGLTKTGTSTLTLGGANTGLTGPININRGNLFVSSLAAVNSASQINFNDAGNFQQFSTGAPSGTLSPPIRVAAWTATGAATQFVAAGPPGSVIALAGILSSGTALPTPVDFTTNGNVGNGFNLTAANNFLGTVSLSGGSLGINADASLGSPANTLSLQVNSLADGGLTFLNGGVTVAHPVTIISPTRIVVNGTDNNTISAAISGTGGVYKAGTGTLTLTNLANTVTGGAVANQGTLSLGSTGQLPAGTNLIVNPTAIFMPPTAANATFGTLTLNGGTFRVPSGTGEFYQVAQVATNPSGGSVNFTGAGSDQLAIVGPSPAITINGNSVWLSPTNGTTLGNAAGVTVPITVGTGITFINGIALTTNSTAGFVVTGGGTLFQNSDATNVPGMTAPITVAQAIFRVTDASSNGGVGNLGTGAFTLDGGTFSYGGLTATSTKPMTLSSNGGTIQIELASTTLSANGAITGPGVLTKSGPGTLVLGNSGNSFAGLTINLGTVQAANDTVLGTGPVTIAAPSVLQYTSSTTTARTFNLNFGTLAAASGATVTLNAASVNGGFLRGPGTFALTGGTTLSGVTTSASTVLSQTGPASYVNVANGGPLTLAPGLAPTSLTVFTNQGSGAITVAPGDTVSAMDFQSYGTLTLAPAASSPATRLNNAGSSPLFFNGGSRTFIGTPLTAGQNLALVDLHGQNAIVAGGLFVNNGFVGDSTASGATIVADFGALVKGAGTYANPVVTQNGGKFQAGNSPGAATFGRFIFGPGGVDNYVFAVDDAAGTAGPLPDVLGQVSGWSLVKSAGDFTWTATPAARLTVALDTLVNPTLVGLDVPGPMDHFDPTRPYTWPAVEWTGTYQGPSDAALLDATTGFDTSGFRNPVAGTFGWQIDLADRSLALTYTPTSVPEPGTLALAGFAVAGWLGCRRRAGSRTRP